MKVLFELTNCETHLAIAGPVAEALRAGDPGVEVSVLSLCEVVGLKTDRAKIERVTSRVFQPYHASFKARSSSQGLAGRVKNLFSYLSVVWSKRRVRRDMESFLDSYRPDIIVFANDRITPHVELIAAAKRQGIPTLLVQESIRKDNRFRIPLQAKIMLALFRRVLGVTEGDYMYHGQGGCDRIAAWGETSLTYFKEVGVPESKVVLTGNPRIESIARADWGKKGADILRSYKVPDGATVVALTTNPIDVMGLLSRDKLLESVSMAMDAVDGIDNVHLFLKPHRLERPEPYEEVAARHAPGRIHVVPGMELFPLLSVSQACLIFNSTVALEAAGMGVPVAILNPFRVDMGVDFAENSLAVEVGDREAITRFIRDSTVVGRGRAGSGRAQKYLAMVEGSSKTIAAEIVKLATEKPASA